MASTVSREDSFWFFLFSREESRIHIHVTHTDGEAKFWLEPSIELALNKGLNSKQVSEALLLVQQHREVILNAWKQHFES